MEKILSIIVPSYNMEAYLPKCLGSLIIDDKDLLQKLDVIVVNDGSKDHTSEMAHEFEAKYPGVFRVIDKSNGHYGSCINAALPIATGKFVKVLDADDSFDTDTFSGFLACLDKIERETPDAVDVIFTDYVRVNVSGDVIGKFTIGLPVEAVFTLDQVPQRDVETLWMQSVTYRTTLFNDIGYQQMEGVPFSDQQWVFYPMSVARLARYFPLPVYKYFVGREGQTIDQTYYAKNFHVIRKLTEKMIDDFPVLTRNCSESNLRFLNLRLYARIKLVYQYHLFPPKVIAFDGTEVDLVRFDRKVKVALPDVYGDLASERYVGRFPLSPISAWRKKVSGNPIPYMFLKVVLVPIATLRYRFVTILSRIKKTHG